MKVAGILSAHAFWFPLRRCMLCRGVCTWFQRSAVRVNGLQADARLEITTTLEEMLQNRCNSCNSLERGPQHQWHSHSKSTERHIIISLPLASVGPSNRR